MKSMTNKEFRRSFVREAANQPGIMLDVQDMSRLSLLAKDDKRPARAANKKQKSA